MGKDIECWRIRDFLTL